MRTSSSFLGLVLSFLIAIAPIAQAHAAGIGATVTPQGGGIGYAFDGGPGGRISQFDPAAIAIFAAFTTPPTSARKALINSFVVTLKNAGVWSALDVLYFIAAADSQAASINWKNPVSFALAQTGTLTFTADHGFKGDGTTGFLTAAGYNPNTAGLNFSLNVGSFGAYVRTAAAINSSVDLFMGTSRFQRSSTGTAYQSRINDATALNYTFGTQIGHFTARRNGAAARQMFLNGTQVASDTTAVTTISTSFVLLSAAGSAFSDGEISYVYTGGALTDQNIIDLNVAALVYLQGVGAA